MKASEIRVGGIYVAKVAGKLTKVRVDEIKTIYNDYPKRDEKRYYVTNLATGRKTTFRSAAKFRSEIISEKEAKLRTDKLGRLLTAAGKLEREEAKQSSDPSTVSTAKTLAKTQTTQQGSTTADIVEEHSLGDNEQPTLPLEPPGHRGPHDEGELKELMEAENRPDPTMTVSSRITTMTSPGSSIDSSLSTLLKRSITKVSNDKAPHLIIKARAGTGKTTTGCEGLKEVRGVKSSITPSPQQQVIWDALKESQGCGPIAFTAFGRDIAAELKKRIPLIGGKPGWDAMTTHAMGYKAVLKAWPNLRGKDPTTFRTIDLIAAELRKDVRDLRRDELELLNATDKLVELCKQTLANPNREGLDYLASYYDVDLNHSKERVFDLVPKILERSKDPSQDGRIDFNDMVWLPIVHKLPVFKYDLMIVDEAQDLNRARQELCKMASRRLICCGDEKQAIFGFAGADAESMQRMERDLSAGVEPYQDSFGHDVHRRGCKVLPLTVTRRCGKAIVAEAQQYVPDFQAHESNPDGIISRASYPIRKDAYGKDQEVSWEKSYLALAKPGDMILCRVNAPLVSNCFRFLKNNIKANILGRDVAKGLLSTIKKMKAENVRELIFKLQAWLEEEVGKEQAKRHPSESRIIAMQDRVDCILCFAEGVDTVDGVNAKINAIFTDNPDCPGIRLSSIHKAKGLEAQKVFLLQPSGATMPHPMAKSSWQIEQEYNLLYVAITRAIKELTYVS